MKIVHTLVDIVKVSKQPLQVKVSEGVCTVQSPEHFIRKQNACSVDVTTPDMLEILTYQASVLGKSAPLGPNAKAKKTIWTLKRKRR